MPVGDVAGVLLCQLLTDAPGKAREHMQVHESLYFRGRHGAGSGHCTAQPQPVQSKPADEHMEEPVSLSLNCAFQIKKTS